MNPADLSLPAPPSSLARVIEAASDATVTVPQLGKIVSSDPTFAVQLLRLVNSSVYSRGSKVSSVDRAVSILGARSLRNLALCVAVRSCVSRRELGDFNLSLFWEDSLRRAVACRLLAERLREGEYEPTEAFTAGLLQDLGTLALVRSNPDVSSMLMEFVACDPEERRAAENDLFGCSHDQLGEALAKAWSLPPELAMPMIHHHNPDLAPARYATPCRVSAHAELLAAVLAGDDKRTLLEQARERLGAEAGLSIREVDALLDQLSTRVGEVAAELGFRVGSQPTLESILQAANSGLVELNLSYEELVRKLERTLAEKDALAQELARRNQELEQLSLTDELTRLPNRRSLSGRLSYEIKRAARGDSLVFVVGDIDKFKSVNDTWGHDFGDLVLKVVAETLLGAVRDTDMVARMGGEEFGIVLPGADLDNAMIAANRILDAVRNRRVTCPDGVERNFTISLGLSSIAGPYKQRVSVERVSTRLYKAADAALYASKEGGRDRATAAKAPLAWADPSRSAA